MESPYRNATLKDVAALAGVAPSTVSRALNLPDRVNERTITRVLEAAQRVGYVTNDGGSHSQRNQLTRVAVAVSDVTNPFYAGLLQGTQQQLKAVGLTHVLIDTEESGRTEVQLLESMRDSYDGLILASSRMPDALLTKIASTTPLVAINRTAPDVARVCIDTAGGVRQAVDHLVSLGHTDIVYVAGPPNSWSGEQRWNAIEEAAQEHSISVRRIGPFPPNRAAGPAAADAVLNTGATACIAFNDLLAIGILTRLHVRGVRVPEDLSIVGCDDIFGADFCSPPLTTITSPGQKAGMIAVSMLLSLSRGDVQPVELPANLIVRGSTGPAARPE